MTQSLYDITEHYGEEIKHLGFDYKDMIISKTMSSYIIQSSDMSTFMTYINDMFYNLIESTKKIRVFINYTVDKNYKNIN